MRVKIKIDKPKEQTDKEVAELLYPGTFGCLCTHGVPQEYAEVMAKAMIQKAIEEFHSYGISEYCVWSLQRVIDAIKSGAGSGEVHADETKD